MVLVMGGEGRMRPGLELEQQGKERVGDYRSRPWFLFLPHPDRTSDPECLALGDIALSQPSTPPAPHCFLSRVGRSVPFPSLSPTSTTCSSLETEATLFPKMRLTLPSWTHLGTWTLSAGPG